MRIQYASQILGSLIGSQLFLKKKEVAWEEFFRCYYLEEKDG